MSDKCEKCGGELVEGNFVGRFAVKFYPLDQLDPQKFIPIPKGCTVTCKCCKKCGLIQDFRAKELSRLR